MEDWIIRYDQYKPDEEPLREALCVLGNGYMATRAAAEESTADKVHYPGTYLTGGYNRLKSEVSGKIIENEDLVNWPNWLVLKMKIEDDDWISPDQVDIVQYEQILDLKHGFLSRKITFKDQSKRATTLVSKRMVSMECPHLCAIQWNIIPENWSGKITIHSALDGRVINNGVERYRDLKGKHLEVLDKGEYEEEGIFLKVMTNQSDIIMGQAARTQVFFDSVDYSMTRNTIHRKEYIAQELDFSVKEKRKVRVEKVVATHTSRDRAISNPLIESMQVAFQAPGFDEMLENQKIAWSEIWDQCDTQIKGNNNHQLMLRLHIFHLFQTVSHNSIDLDTGVPARGLHGEAYRGHIFWDELFIFPILNLSAPELSRALLLYRYRRLRQARREARLAGYKGAMYPWQSGSNGREESQHIHLNPKSGRWIPDHTYLQRHVNATIAFNVWKYFQTTKDQEFMSFFGAEMLLNIANFWSSIAHFNEQRDRYEIHHVVGPDEYHTQYPDSKEPGLKNNAYTNIMAVWTIMKTLDACDMLDKKHLSKLLKKLNIEEDHFELWERITRKMYIPFHEDGRIISQFEGFENLKDLDWKYYHANFGEILRLDRILEKEGKSVNQYKAVKQADVLMLFFLLSAEELTDIFKRLDYDFDPESIPENIEYYSKITSHGSTLSKLVHSWVTARSDRTASWQNFEKALISDFSDIQGGTTQEGIHLGAMAGTVDLIQRCYTGMEVREGAIWFNPQLPEALNCIKYRLKYRNHWLKLNLDHEFLRLKCDGGLSEEVDVIVHGRKYAINRGQERKFKIN
jgi:trehalose/maltose hydrolase-like predicted phosphorylase